MQLQLLLLQRGDGPASRQVVVVQQHHYCQ